MKTQYYTAASINGYLADEHGSLDWLFQFGEIESMQDSYPHFVEQIGAVAMGATTYTWVLNQEKLLENPDKWPYSMPTWVFSRRQLPLVAGADIRLVQGDVARVHAEMVAAAKGKNVWIVGGGDLAGQFLDHGLLDDLILTIAPVMLRSGAPLLPRDLVTPPLKLTRVEQHGDVYAVLVYAVQRTTAAA